MKGKLVAANVADDQIPGLLRVYRSALAEHLAQQHLVIVGALVLFSLLVASFGFSLMLLGKLRAVGRTEGTPVREARASYRVLTVPPPERSGKFHLSADLAH